MLYNKNQQGITLISLILILVVVCSGVLIVLKVVPIYMNHGKVVHALESLKNRDNIMKQSKREIWISLNKQFGMNYVEHVKKEHVKITARSNYLKVQIIYHVKQPLVSNLSVWVDFDDMIELGTK